MVKDDHCRVWGVLQNLQFHIAQCIRTQEKMKKMSLCSGTFQKYKTIVLHNYPLLKQPEEPWFVNNYLLWFGTKLRPFQVHCSWFRPSCGNCQLQERRMVVKIFSSINQDENSAPVFSTPTAWLAFCVRTCPAVCVFTHNLWYGNMSLVLIF